MGMYTCLQFIGVVKKEYEKFVKKIVEIDDCEDFNWNDYVEKYPFLENFVKKPRSCMIPYGCFTSYNERKLGIKDTNHNELIASWFNDFVNTEYTWTFACDLKDYDDEIETFIEEVAVNLCDNFIALQWYEETAFPTIYFYENGKLEKRGFK